MIDRIESLDMDSLNERIDQINSELKRVRADMNKNVLDSGQPRSPRAGQIWFGSGKIYLWNGNEIETYSKD